MSKVRGLLSQAEECIISGQFPRARRLLNSIPIKKISRDQILLASSLSRRCGLIHRSLKIMNPFIMNKASTLAPPSTEEQGDYAYSLFRAGAKSEAKKRLLSIRSDDHPQVQFYLALLYFSEWNYPDALPLLEKYIQSRKISDYRRKIGISNLIACYIFMEQYEVAEKNVRLLEAEINPVQFRLLKNLCLEQRAEILVKKGCYKDAISLIDRAIVSAEGSGDTLNSWLNKWKIIAEAFKSRSRRSIENLNQLKNTSINKRQWEIARDCDFHRIQIDPVQDITNLLFYGTPYKEFRRRMEKSGKKPNEEFSTEINFPVKHECTKTELNLTDHTIKNGNWIVSSQFTQSDWLLIKRLVVDFYRPPQLGELFEALYPNECYFPESSPNRVHQRLFRLNKKMTDIGIDLRIQSDNSFFKIYGDGPVVVRNSLPNILDDSIVNAKLKLLSSNLGKASFKSKHVQKLLAINERTCQRWLKRQVAEGRIVKMGSGPSTIYKIAS